MPEIVELQDGPCNELGKPGNTGEIQEVAGVASVHGDCVKQEIQALNAGRSTLYWLFILPIP